MNHAPYELYLYQRILICGNNQPSTAPMPLDQENFGYNATVMDHFQTPRNAGDMENPSCIGLARNSDCGDLLKLYLRIEDERIVDAKFKTYGCGAAIASSSKLTEMLIGRTLEAAARIKNTDVAEALGGLPAHKVHCSVLAQQATAAALADWQQRQT